MLAKPKRTWLREDVERHGIVDVGQQLAQFQHRLARQDHFRRG